MALCLALLLAFIFRKLECVIGYVYIIGSWSRFILYFFYENHAQRPNVKGTHQ